MFQMTSESTSDHLQTFLLSPYIMYNGYVVLVPTTPKVSPCLLINELTQL